MSFLTLEQLDFTDVSRWLDLTDGENAEFVYTL